MKALSVRQPYAWLIMRGIKTVENRAWMPRISLPCDIAVHASSRKMSRMDWEIFRGFCADEKIECPQENDILYGHYLGVVRVEGITTRPRHLTAQDILWAEDDCCWWILRDPRIIPPFKMNGRLGLFDVPDSAVTLFSR